MDHPFQTTVEQQQDLQLELMNQSLNRLHAQQQDVQRELTTQVQVLQDLDDEVQEASNTLTNLLNKIDKQLKNRDTNRLCCILVLIIVAIVLILAVVM